MLKFSSIFFHAQLMKLWSCKSDWKSIHLLLLLLQLLSLLLLLLAVFQVSFQDQEWEGEQLTARTAAFEQLSTAVAAVFVCVCVWEREVDPSDWQPEQLPAASSSLPTLSKAARMLENLIWILNREHFNRREKGKRNSWGWFAARTQVSATTTTTTSLLESNQTWFASLI